MGYYDALHDTNSCYLHLLQEYQFNPGIYSSWRHFLEVTHLEGWRHSQTEFENYDDFISFWVLDWAFYIQDENVTSQSVELACEMLKVDPKLLHYCKHQIENDGIIPILKNHLILGKRDFLKKSINLALGT